MGQTGKFPDSLCIIAQYESFVKMFLRKIEKSFASRREKTENPGSPKERNTGISGEQ